MVIRTKGDDPAFREGCGKLEGLLSGKGGCAMEFSGSVTQMIHRLRSDDPRERDEAARLIWEHYFRDLLALAQQHLGYRIRHKVDAEDVLQSMYASVCRRQLRGDFELYGRDDFWKLLVTITLNKVRNTANWHLRAKLRRSSRVPSGASFGAGSSRTRSHTPRRVKESERFTQCDIPRRREDPPMHS